MKRFDDLRQLLLDETRKRGSWAAAYQALDVPNSTASKWRKTHPDFDAEVHAAEADSPTPPRRKAPTPTPTPAGLPRPPLKVLVGKDVPEMEEIARFAWAVARVGEDKEEGTLHDALDSVRLQWARIALDAVKVLMGVSEKDDDDEVRDADFDPDDLMREALDVVRELDSESA